MMLWLPSLSEIFIYSSFSSLFLQKAVILNTRVEPFRSLKCYFHSLPAGFGWEIAGRNLGSIISVSVCVPLHVEISLSTFSPVEFEMWWQWILSEVFTCSTHGVQNTKLQQHKAKIQIKCFSEIDFWHVYALCCRMQNRFKAAVCRV